MFKEGANGWFLPAAPDDGHASLSQQWQEDGADGVQLSVGWEGGQVDWKTGRYGQGSQLLCQCMVGCV